MSAAYDRLAGGYYNSNPKTDLNPGGMAAGGHVTNFPAALDDTATVAAEAAASALAADTSADAAAASAASAVNAPGTSATSTSSVAIGTGSKSFTLAQAGKAFAVGQTVVAADNAAPGTNFMVGPITAFDAGTGAMTINVPTGMAFGSGTKADWTISLSGVAQPFSGGSLTSALNEAKATVASHATTAAIWAAAGNLIDFTGTATITDFPDAPQPGARRVLICAGACTFTHNANIFVPGAANYTAAAGDVVHVIAVTTTTFRLEITRVGGTAVVGGSAVLISENLSGSSVTRTNLSQAYQNLLILVDSASHNNGSTRGFTVEISADNGSTWNSVSSFNGSGLAASAQWSGIGMIFDYPNSGLKACIAGAGAPLEAYMAASFTGSSMVRVNAVRISITGGAGSFDGGSWKIIGLI